MPTLEGRTVLDELNHRIRNELASVINLITFKAVWIENVDAKKELGNIVDLLHQHVEVHNLLTMPDNDALADAGERLRKLGLAMSRCKLERRTSACSYWPTLCRCKRTVLALGARHLRGPPRLGGAERLRGLDRGGRPNLRGVEGRAAADSAKSYSRNNYTSYGDHYGHGSRYGAYAAAAAYGYGRSYATSEDGCYYVPTYRRSRRVLVCPDN
jgi:hypothetical protein